MGFRWLLQGKNARPLMQVPDRKEKTLLAAIKEHIELGSPYYPIAGIAHFTVNHTLTL